ncbi:hypothetical protein [Rhodocaloribacter sp.]
MELHERQQFDFLLVTAVERFSERLVQRNEGAENALRRLRENPQGEGIWVDEFVDAVFRDFLLDNVAGACFVLQALGRRRVALPAVEARVEDVLQRLARRAFADLLTMKIEEALEQAASYSG